MVVALEHRHDRNEPDHDEDAYSRSGDVPGMDVVSAGSVTSFVRKLFQMVQGECDSIVGFVADGTAFEVKDPRRLEQDILPKYFRHSRFQSLVRQLNFYSFKKISKERSVWIYKHAFFRRDEPELLHALKRKTNQHGAPARVGGGVAGLGVGDGGADDMMVVDRAAPIVGGSLSRDPLDNNKARSRGLSFLPPRHADGGGGAFRPPHRTYHHSPSFSNQHQEHHQHPPHYPHQHGSNGDRHSSRSSRPPHHPHSAHRKNGSSGSGRMYHASSSRGAGGGPSTGGAAVPSYGGQGPSSRGGAPGFAWAGAGGRPVSSSGGPGAEYDRRSGGVDGGSGMRATKAGGHRGFDDGRSPSSSSSSQAYSRQGPAIGDDRGSALGRQRGGGGGGGGGGNGGPAAAAAAGGGAGGGGATDKDHALALFGLSALCQVASATEAPAAHDKESIGQMDEDGGGGSGGGGRGSRRLSDGVDRQQQKRHRGVGPEAEARSRRGWAVQESSGDEEREEEEEEDGVTSAERDDSSLSNHRRSPSNSSCVSSSSSSSNSLVSSADSSDGGFERHHHGSSDNGVFVQPPTTTTTTTTDAKTTVPRQQQQQRTSGSGGVFCPTWDWGRAACEPAIRLPGSFVDRRFEEVDQQVVKDDDDNDEDDDDVSSRAEEEERDEGESRQEFALESDDKGPETSAPHRRGEAMAITDEVSVSLAGSDEPRPTPTASVPPRPRDAQADMKAEADVGLEGIGAFFSHCCSAAASGDDTTRASESVFLATVANSGDGGLREMAVFCAGPAGKAPDAAPAAYLAREVSLFLQSEEAVAEDLRVYADALDPAAVDVVVEGSLGSSSNPAAVTQPLSPDGAKLLRVFCRFAACRLGRALEVASLVAESAEEAAAGGGGGDKAAEQQGLLLQRHGAFARRAAPQLDSCRWKWWRAAVRFS